jgi:hypothetical protein
VNTRAEADGHLVAHNPEEHPRASPFHDILLVREEFVPGQRSQRLERFAIDKTSGFYKNEPESLKAPVRPQAEGYRPTINLASFGRRGEQDPGRGPALATLPLHPSPAASSATTCYLVNPENLNYGNAWTAEEWSDAPGGYDAQGRVGKDEFSLLIASPAGKVYYLQKKPTPTSPPRAAAEASGERELQPDEFVLKEVALRFQTEIWAQLRGGCVVGRALYNGAPASAPDKLVPLVNIDSLTPAEQ